MEDNRPKTRKKPDLNKLAPESDRSSKKKSEAYSSPKEGSNSSSGSNGGIKFFDVNDLKERQKSSEKKDKTGGEVNYDEDEFL